MKTARRSTRWTGYNVGGTSAQTFEARLPLICAESVDLRSQNVKRHCPRVLMIHEGSRAAHNRGSGSNMKQ